MLNYIKLNLGEMIVFAVVQLKIVGKYYTVISSILLYLHCPLSVSQLTSREMMPG